MPEDTIKVRVKRSDEHEFKSTDLDRYICGGLSDQFETGGVDVKKLQLYLDLEVRDESLFVYNNIYSGLGGHPLSTQESVLTLISCGFDSFVASYMTMRHGAKPHILFLN